MPTLNDIRDHDLLGPILKSGIQEGRQEAAPNILRRLLTKKFGPS